MSLECFLGYTNQPMHFMDHVPIGLGGEEHMRQIAQAENRIGEFPSITLGGAARFIMDHLVMSDIVSKVEENFQVLEGTPGFIKTFFVPQLSDFLPLINGGHPLSLIRNVERRFMVLPVETDGCRSYNSKSLTRPCCAIVPAKGLPSSRPLRVLCWPIRLASTAFARRQPAQQMPPPLTDVRWRVLERSVRDKK